MTILDYHERTKHSVASLRASQHVLDWAIQPRPFKVYTTLDPIPLPRDVATSDVPALEAVASPAVPDAPAPAPDCVELARLLHFTAGITRTKQYPNGFLMHFRAAACTGALYHVDVYLVCGPLPDLAAGVYHFDPHDAALRRLRAGDYRAAVAAAIAGEPAVAAAPAVMVCTSTFWRNAWKYQARTYRHCFWDTGTMLANLFAVAAADRVPARLVLGFVDEAITHLLGLDPAKEATVALVALGPGGAAPPGPAPPQPALALETLPLSTREVDYPLIRAAHTATSLATADAVRAWRGVPPARAPVPADPGVPLAPPAAARSPSIERVILRRGSARHFARASITFAQLSAMLAAATGGIPADCLGDGPSPVLNELYLIVHAVDGLAAGAYVYAPEPRTLTLLRAGDFRREAGFLDLGQELAADAAVNCYFLADLDRVCARFGARGYRAAQLEAAIAGGKLYLAAYALGLGATGLTFFDDAVTDFFSPHAAGKAVMFLLAAGQPGRRPELAQG